METLKSLTNHKCDKIEKINYSQFIKLVVVVSDYYNLIYVSQDTIDEMWQNYCDFEINAICTIMLELGDIEKHKRF
jgi:hypothetical protein